MLIFGYMDGHVCIYKCTNVHTGGYMVGSRLYIYIYMHICVFILAPRHIYVGITNSSL